MENGLEQKVVAGLERLGEVFRHLYWEKAKNHGLSPIQIRILLFLKNHRGQLGNVSHLAREFHLTKPTISDAVRVLIEKELVYKERSVQDGRSFQLRLTPKSKDLIVELENYSEPVLESLRKLPVEDLNSSYKIITKIIYLLNRTGVIQVQRMCFACKHYRNDGSGHFCNLMEKPLADEEIRLDCPEFEE